MSATSSATPALSHGWNQMALNPNPTVAAATAAIGHHLAPVPTPVPAMAKVVVVIQASRWLDAMTVPAGACSRTRAQERCGSKGGGFDASGGITKMATWTKP